MLDYSLLKIVVGTANVSPIEDPVLGSNGTQCIRKINGFIQRVQEDLVTMVPQGKGNLIVGGGADEPIELQVGVNNYCLTVDPSTPSGIKWEERVDLTSVQTVGGKKTFTSDVSMMQDLYVASDVEVGANATITGNVSALNGHLRGTLEVGLSTLMHSTLTVENSTTLRTNLTVQGASMLSTAVVSSTLNVGGASTLDSSLRVVGSTTMDSNLSVDGAINVSGSVVVGNDVLIADSLSVSGASNMTSLAVTGPTSLASTTATALTVTGSANLTALSLSGALAVGTTLTTGGGITAGGAVVASSTLTVAGTSTLAGVTSTSTVTSGSTTTGKLVALQGTTLNDTLWVGGATNLRSTLSVASNAVLSGDVTVSGLSKLGGTSTKALSVVGPALVQGLLTIDGSVLAEGDITVGGSAFIEGSGTVELDLTVGGNTLLVGTLQAPTASITNLTSTTGAITTLTSDVVKGRNVEYTGTLTGNTATVYSLSANDVTSTTIDTTNLVVTGSAVIPNLSGTNTGDEVLATPTLTGTVRITSAAPDPIVYTVTDAQAAFIGVSERGTTLATLVAGKIPINQLPPLAISDTHVVPTIAEMNSLIAQVGDVAILTDPASTYILQTEPNGWVMLNTPTDAVPSVFNRVGPIQAVAGDYTATMIPLTSIATLNATTVQSGIAALVSSLNTHRGDVTNPHDITAEQIEAIPIWEKGSGLGVATLDVSGKVPVEQLPVDLLGASKVVVSFTSTDLVNSVLVVQHNLSDKYPSSITVYNNLGRVVVPDDIEVVDDNSLKVDLSSYSTLMGAWRVAIGV